MSATKRQKKFKDIILFLLMLLSFAKSLFNEISLTKSSIKETFSLNDEVLKCLIKEINNYAYLKIIVSGNQPGKETNHIISYYQDKNLNERKQLMYLKV